MLTDNIGVYLMLSRNMTAHQTLIGCHVLQLVETIKAMLGVFLITLKQYFLTFLPFNRPATFDSVLKVSFIVVW